MGASEMQTETEREGGKGGQLTRDGGSVQHDLDTVSETTEL